jgi:hypothetical protein
MDNLPRLPAPLRPLARFEVRDHLGDPAAPSIKANVVGYLARNGIDLAGGTVLMLASARVLGYVFNPLSVFWCYAASARLQAVLAEVHNTYHQRHVYLLRPGEDGLAEAAKEFYVSPNTPSRGEDCGGLPPNTKMPPCGTTYKMVFSKDSEQKYMYVADGTNDHVWILDRNSGKTLGSFGSNGKYAGQFHWINAVGIDSTGNIYTGEVEQAKRIQKFVPVQAGSR